MKIPQKILNMKIGEDFNGVYTVKNELERYNDVITDYDYNLENGKLLTFHAWSKKHVFVLIDDLFGDQMIVAIPRNPPRRKKK